MVRFRLLGVSRFYSFVTQVRDDAKQASLRDSRYHVPKVLLPHWSFFLKYGRDHLVSPLTVTGVDEQVFLAFNGSQARRAYGWQCMSQPSVRQRNPVQGVGSRVLRKAQASLAHDMHRDPALNRAIGDIHNHSTQMARSRYVYLRGADGARRRSATVLQREEQDGAHELVEAHFASLAEGQPPSRPLCLAPAPLVQRKPSRPLCLAPLVQQQPFKRALCLAPW